MDWAFMIGRGVVLAGDREHAALGRLVRLEPLVKRLVSDLQGPADGGLEISGGLLLPDRPERRRTGRAAAPAATGTWAGVPSCN